jgi:eukaryotic-like serine/threonine-protein kinase
VIDQTISHYKILEKLGEGGMGVVYKAQDTKLDRFVALKFLPPHLSASEADKARFMQEAKAASALNHPNVCTIYAIEEHEHQLFIAMEYVDGQTLRDLVRSNHDSTLPIKRAIDIGIQIADGLAAAHEKGIVHRDIKPGNIMIRKDGMAQIMDFGLAKLRGNVTRLTKEGSTVGTAGYMSPEQVQGSDADHRSDIFSLGVLLYELFTGQIPFKAVHETALMYEIVNVDAVPMAAANAEIGPELDHIVLECLEKDPSERYQSAAEISKDLKRFKRESSRARMSRIVPSQAMQHGSVAPQSTGLSGGRSLPPLAWILSTGILLLACALLAFLYVRKGVTERRTTRSSLLPPETKWFVSRGAGNFALSLDGSTLAFVARDSSGTNVLWIRPLDGIASHPLSSTEGAEWPFWSADGKMLGFFANGKLKKVELSGAPAQIVCDAAWGRGGAWNQDGVIIYSPTPFGPLSRVLASGGVPTSVTRLDTTTQENTHRWPLFLPDGKHFLYLGRTANNQADVIHLASLDTAEKATVILHASSNVAYSAGHLLYMRDHSLIAQPFDAKSLELAGDAFPIADRIYYDPSFNRAIFSASVNGLLIYQQGNAGGSRQLVWYDRSGKKLGAASKTGDYLDLRLSPDGKRVAIAQFDYQSRNYDIWIHDFSRDVPTRFTFDPAFHRLPIWSPDGLQIIFASNRGGHWNICRKAASGAGTEDILLDSNVNKIATDWSPDGTRIAFFTTGDRKTNSDSWILNLPSSQTGARAEAIPFLRTEFSEGQGATFSPDGKWVAYQSDQSGKNEVYVRPLSGPGGERQISTAGGTRPHWRRNGKEIYYLGEDGKFTAAEIRINGSALELGSIRSLFKVDAVRNVGGISFLDGSAYDVTADGQRFLVNVFLEDTTPYPATLVVNWDEAMKKK